LSRSPSSKIARWPGGPQHLRRWTNTNSAGDSKEGKVKWCAELGVEFPREQVSDTTGPRAAVRLHLHGRRAWAQWKKAWASLARNCRVVLARATPESERYKTSPPPPLSTSGHTVMSDRRAANRHRPPRSPRCDWARRSSGLLRRTEARNAGPPFEYEHALKAEAWSSNWLSQPVEIKGESRPRFYAPNSAKTRGEGRRQGPAPIERE